MRSGTVDAAAAAALAVAVVRGRRRAARAGAPGRGAARPAGRGHRSRSTRPRSSAAPPPTCPGARLPGNLHVTFTGCEGDSLLYLFDAEGIAVSTGSACRAGVPEPSHVLYAMGVPEVEARGALRFSFGRTSTDADVDRVLEVLPGILRRARAAAARVTGAAVAS